MAQYVDKSVLVAEIEKRYNECLERANIIDADYWNGKADAYRNVLVILNDTPEVKNVDLNVTDEQEIEFLRSLMFQSATYHIFDRINERIKLLKGE